MKKQICLFTLIFIVCVMIMTGCSREFVNKDEFYIYDGKEIAAIMESYDVDNFDFSEAMSEDGALSGRKLNTKRGIKIGSSVKDIARKYKDVYVMVTSEEIKYYEDFGIFLDERNTNNVTCVVLILGRVDGDNIINIKSEEENNIAQEAMYLVFYIDKGIVYNISTIYYNEMN